uniref:Uncharacterized protein n=1 Tax=Aplanochytrium stocchinoi TaxID=215587 RepID=A0A7S3PPU9_9STRA|mmetsp:Transcript_2038/g.2616  ORF Transcript_2038/g.2616 Transcript_2038/m.2616 type:complete len:336 (-) Transcript_2038:542-1549(-)
MKHYTLEEKPSRSACEENIGIFHIIYYLSSVAIYVFIMVEILLAFIASLFIIESTNGQSERLAKASLPFSVLGCLTLLWCFVDRCFIGSKRSNTHISYCLGLCLCFGDLALLLLGSTILSPARRTANDLDGNTTVDYDATIECFEIDQLALACLIVLMIGSPLNVISLVLRDIYVRDDFVFVDIVGLVEQFFGENSPQILAQTCVNVVFIFPVTIALTLGTAYDDMAFPTLMVLPLIVLIVVSVLYFICFGTRIDGANGSYDFSLMVTLGLLLLFSVTWPFFVSKLTMFDAICNSSTFLTFVGLYATLPIFCACIILPCIYLGGGCHTALVGIQK